MHVGGGGGGDSVTGLQIFTPRAVVVTLRRIGEPK